MRILKAIVAMAAVVSFICLSCTNNPTLDPDRTTAKANLQQAQELHEIAVQLKRIADQLEQNKLTEKH